VLGGPGLGLGDAPLDFGDAPDPALDLGLEACLSRIQRIHMGIDTLVRLTQPPVDGGWGVS